MVGIIEDHEGSGVHPEGKAQVIVSNALPTFSGEVGHTGSTGRLLVGAGEARILAFVAQTSVVVIEGVAWGAVGAAVTSFAGTAVCLARTTKSLSVYIESFLANSAGI